jgi:hypothetical protein
MKHSNSKEEENILKYIQERYTEVRLVPGIFQFTLLCEKHNIEAVLTFGEVMSGCPFCTQCHPELKFLQKADNSSTIGKTEGTLFKMKLLKMCSKYGIQVIAQYPVLEWEGRFVNNEYKQGGAKYYVDYYLPEKKIAIEFDERYHMTETQTQKDIEREDTIKTVLDCYFIRFSEKEFLEEVGYFSKHLKNELQRIKEQKDKKRKEMKEFEKKYPLSHRLNGLAQFSELSKAKNDAVINIEK